MNMGGELPGFGVRPIYCLAAFNAIKNIAFDPRGILSSCRDFIDRILLNAGKSFMFNQSIGE
jgi:hypothetical protein